MNYELRLRTGEIFNLTGASIDTDNLVDLLNNPQILFVNFGGILLSKHVVEGLFPIISGEQIEDVKEEQSDQTQA
ncbi:hypothetical protein [Lysinibacillus sp. NPDC096212]|uniref:hypothetical protein n=1 Tax=Lysinibacillus sp. NPDC096212 TaxID=3364135 RepID=UPI0037FBC551